MNTDAGVVVLQVIIAIAGSTVIGQAVTAFSNRRKVRADSVDVLSDNAITQVKEMRTEMDGMRAAVREFRRTLDEHLQWDRHVMKVLHDEGVEVGPPPELWI